MIIQTMYERKDHLSDGVDYVPFSQVNVVREFYLRINMMNKIFKQLGEDNLIHLMEGKHDKYILTNIAETIIQNIAQLRTKVD